jgi:hypothetical protein|tara:strand:+ start:4485 stop:5945 length:1461 start_codon:yes stop_codon:yes gene_type:complete
MAVSGVPAAGYTPAPKKQALASAYLDFTNGTNDWAQQYLPDLMEKEAEVFGNRTISGFLSQVGAEESMSSDQVIWTEQGRLHLSYKLVNITQGSGGVKDADLTFAGNTTDVDGTVVAGTAHGIRPGDMLLVSDADATARMYVEGVTAAGVVQAKRYDGANAVGGSAGEMATGGDVSVLVFGSEYSKATTGRTGANAPGFKSRSNKPIILKDKYEVSGSDASAIGWVEVSGEEGQSGYLWYLKASGDTKARFSDYLEMAMMESVTGAGTAPTSAGTNGGAITGTEGLFEALETRGNISTTLDNTATLQEFDDIIDELDANGAIEENMMFLDRATSLNIDDMLAGLNGNYATGTSYGVFNNEADMALNLGFTGFRRGSYDFYKSDFKYLNDKSTRGLINATDGTNAIHGVMIPAGVSSVYDQSLGKNLKRPFLHVRYRASQLESRKYKTWTTGSVGATTSDLDAMEMHFLSERCLVVQGANNFVLMKG